MIPSAETAGSIGLYLHIPFCRSKCPYCDFYSLVGGEEEKDVYTDALIREIRHWAQIIHRRVDTLYLGGGTPTQLGARRLYRIITAAREVFGIENGEITCEANPGSDLSETFYLLQEAGVNRISMGMQSGNPHELAVLQRGHTVEDVKRASEDARAAKIENISLDLMLGLPGQTTQEIRHSVALCRELSVWHLSAYLLKIEPGTPFAQMGDALVLPGEEEQCQLYEFLCEEAASQGWQQYEISNFACPGKECRHNLKYWDDREYLGLGPSAHSFLNGRRFYYPRDISAFCAQTHPVDDGIGGDFEEYAMLRLRLNEGLTEHAVYERFQHGIPLHMRKKAMELGEMGYTIVDTKGIRLTTAGFLLSNAVIGALLET